MVNKVSDLSNKTLPGPAGTSGFLSHAQAMLGIPTGIISSWLKGNVFEVESRFSDVNVPGYLGVRGSSLLLE